jgi:ABC-2 type transport system permease protein
MSVVHHHESRPSAGSAPRPWLAVWSLAWREWLRFIRQRNRVIGAVGQPLLFWLFFGEGLRPTFHMPGGESQMTFREYFFPGTLALILLFTAIFTTISIIEDRREGFLQSVLVAPMSRWAMVLGKLLGGSAIALAQALLFLVLGLTLGIPFSPLGWSGLVIFAAVTALALTGLGFVIAWRTDSVQGFHAIMSVFLFPLWLLSGAFFPAPDGWLGVVMRCNPLTYAVAGLRRLIYLGDAAAAVAGLPSLAVCWGVTLAFAALTVWASWRVAGQRTAADML